MRLIITSKAFSDVDFIGDFIRSGNPERATSFVAEIFAKCRDLRDFPEAYPLIAPHRDKQIRRRVHGNYLIIYRVRVDAIVILHVLRSSMNVERALFNEQ